MPIALRGHPEPHVLGDNGMLAGEMGTACDPNSDSLASRTESSPSPLSSFCVPVMVALRLKGLGIHDELCTHKETRGHTDTTQWRDQHTLAPPATSSPRFGRPYALFHLELVHAP